MKLTRKAEYAIRAILYLSAYQEASAVLTSDIAKNMDIPKQFLAQVMLLLSKNKYVKAKRGACGGFILAKKPSEISVKDVIESVEGKIALNDCLISDNNCKRISFCPLQVIWEKAQRNMIDVLAEINFEKLSKDLIVNLEKKGEDNPIFSN